MIYDATLPYDLKVLSGVAQFLQEGGEFITYTEEDALRNQRLPDLRSWRGDGVIADFDDPGVADAVLRCKLPAVGFGGGFGWYPSGAEIPYFFSDQRRIGIMAAEHLMERGFRNFGYCDFARTRTNVWSEERGGSFAEHLMERGFSCSFFHPAHKTTRRWDLMLASLGKWLRSLPKPVAVLGANDRRAYHVLEACRSYQIRVPDEVAVLGADNDEMLCQLSTPTLSSIEQGAKRIGYEAAVLLDRTMKGEKRHKRRFVIPPICVVTRRSTDVLAIDDKVTAAAMNFVRSQVCKGITVKDVVNASGVSRSTLDNRFKALLGGSIHDLMRSTQMERARQLISVSNLSMKEIAASTGFGSVQYMTSLFGRAYGQTPAEYRKKFYSINRK